MKQKYTKSIYCFQFYRSQYFTMTQEHSSESSEPMDLLHTEEDAESVQSGFADIELRIASSNTNAILQI